MASAGRGERAGSSPDACGRARSRFCCSKPRGRGHWLDDLLTACRARDRAPQQAQAVPAPRRAAGAQLQAAADLEEVPPAHTRHARWTGLLVAWSWGGPEAHTRSAAPARMGSGRTGAHRQASARSSAKGRSTPLTARGHHAALHCDAHSSIARMLAEPSEAAQRARRGSRCSRGRAQRAAIARLLPRAQPRPTVPGLNDYGII